MADPTTVSKTVPQLLSGARGTITINRTITANGSTTSSPLTIALATDINVNVRHDLRPVYLVGSMNAVLIEPTGIDVDCSIGRVIPVSRTDTATGNNVSDVQKTSIGYGIETSINSILDSSTVDIVIQDNQTNKIIAKVVGARFTGRSTGLSTGDIGSERYNFVGIYDAGPVGTGSKNESTATTGYGDGLT